LPWQVAVPGAGSYLHLCWITAPAMSFLKISKLFSSARKRSWHVPVGQRVYAIGDIHGRDDLLGELLEMVDADDRTRGPCESQLIFLGDLVDRGPTSCQVVERLRTLSESRFRPARFLMGNHEEVFLKALTGHLPALKFLVRIGGRATLLSYGITEEEYRSSDYQEIADRLIALVPQSHIDFLSAFEDQIIVGDYLFVHAGIRPGTALSEQKPSDLRWIREDFLKSNQLHGKLVVHGHSITEEVEERTNRIGIDTGAYRSGKLTALGLEGTERWTLSTAKED
jgi:serine/threonine protein phosphatase 1